MFSDVKLISISASWERIAPREWQRLLAANSTAPAASGGLLVGSWWAPGGPLVGPWWAPGGPLVAPRWPPGGPQVAPWWPPGGTLVAPWWDPGALVGPWWPPGGPQVAPRWPPRWPPGGHLVGTWCPWCPWCPVALWPCGPGGPADKRHFQLASSLAPELRRFCTTWTLLRGVPLSLPVASSHLKSCADYTPPSSRRHEQQQQPLAVEDPDRHLRS